MPRRSDDASDVEEEEKQGLLNSQPVEPEATTAAATSREAPGGRDDDNGDAEGPLASSSPSSSSSSGAAAKLPSSPTGTKQQPEESVNLCRICLVGGPLVDGQRSTVPFHPAPLQRQEEDEVVNLDTPCSCAGTQRFAHRACIQR